MRVLVMNGPNLNLLGTREPEIYGDRTLADLDRAVVGWGAGMGVEVDTVQSNDESTLISLIQGSDHDGIVLNPAAFTHTSRALADAVRSTTVPVVEVHISNIKNREPWRAVSVISDACALTIYGRGVIGYQHAIRHLVNRRGHHFDTIGYGPHFDNLADLRWAERGLVILVHGGFWRQEWGRDTMESLAVDLARRGISTMNVEYRRLDQGPAWPGPGHDVLMAIEHTPQLERRFASVVLVGHSAGGYLAMWAGTRTSIPVGLFVGLAPVTSLGRLAAADLSQGSSEAALLLEAGAPLEVEPSTRAVVVHGTEDRQVDPDQSEALRSKAIVLTPDTGHFQLLDPDREHWSWVVEAIDTAL